MQEMGQNREKEIEKREREIEKREMEVGKKKRIMILFEKKKLTHAEHCLQILENLLIDYTWSFFAENS